MPDTCAKKDQCGGESRQQIVFEESFHCGLVRPSERYGGSWVLSLNLSCA